MMVDVVENVSWIEADGENGREERIIEGLYTGY